uniref:D-alanyl-D-alanine carboxypeptidase family protein n=1 Tax=Eubacterium sp. TaxID=142586 RepID=UPI003FF02327
YKPDRKIYAEAYMLINLDDDSYPVVAQKNIDERLYPASLTKIVTAMVTLENVKDVSVKTKMSQAAYDASVGTGAQVAGITVGEELSVDTLLYLTMVHSACDACEVLAEFVGGTKENFVKMMNDWVKKVGCNDTNFTNPSGLHDDNHYTTARDMSKITLAALKNANFVKYSTTTEYEYKGYTLPHTNLMLHPGYVTYYYEYAQGIKTGSTEQAEYNVIVKASKDGYNYLAIVMKSPQQKIKNQSYLTKCSFVDAKSLFEWAFDSLKYTTIIAKDEVIGEVSVENGKDADTVALVAANDTNVIVPVGLDKSAVIIEIQEKPSSLQAPVTKGQKVCSANIIYGDEVIASVPLVAAKTVELSTFLKVINAIKAFFGLTVVKVILVIAFLAIVLYVYIFFKSLNKKKKVEKRRQSRRDSRLGPDDLEPPRRR